MIYFTVIWISLVISEKHSAAMYRGWIQDGDGRGEQNGGHGAVLGGAAGRDEKTVGGLWSTRVLLSVQRIPAE